MAANAGAEIITVNPDGTSGSDNLAAAITTLNASPDANNVIVLNPGRYTPAPTSSSAGSYTINRNVVITGNHALQANGGVPGVQNGLGTPGTPSTYIDLTGTDACQQIFSIAPGVQVAIEAVQVENAPTCTHASDQVILDQGTLLTYGLTMSDNAEAPLRLATSSSTASLNESTVDGGFTPSPWGIVIKGGTLDLTNSDVTDNYAGGINCLGTCTINAIRSIIEHNGPAAGAIDCQGPPTGTMTVDGSGSVDDPDVDAGCDTQYDVSIGPWPQLDTNGGPVQTLAIDPNLGAGYADQTGCPTVDERFFVNPSSNGNAGSATCYAGAYTPGATQQTAGPRCEVTNLQEGADPEEDVTATDTGSGLGPEMGTGSDPQAQGGAEPFTNVATSDGAVSLPLVPLSSTYQPASASLAVIATRPNDGKLAHWFFTADNWAGISTLCV